MVTCIGQLPLQDPDEDHVTCMVNSDAHYHESCGPGAYPGAGM